MRMSRLMLLLSAFVLAACNAQNRQSGVRHQDFARVAVDLFRSACVLTQGSFEPVSKFAVVGHFVPVGKEDLSRLPPAVAEPDARALWMLEQDSGVYYLSLSDNSCSVKAKYVDAAVLLEHFDGLVRQPPKNTNIELRAQQAVQTPFEIRQVSYAWREAGSSEETVLTAQTADSPDLPVQAVLNLTHRSHNGKPLILP
ncbi:NMCC_0638 family (lipo)protein [Neisseria polysaccharea]|uniref:NMCC_0638 family (lipo)protein n=1 Tax=Neisseria polysaccharea TaxID=489 RepID=UPI003F733632